MTGSLELLESAVGQLVEQDPHALADAALLDSTERLLKAVNRIHGVMARRLQVIDVRDATTVECGRATRSWLVEQQCVGRAEANKLVTVAKALPARQVIESALLAGEINLEHARNIAVSTREVDPAIQDVVEKELVKAAEYVDPTTLGAFARELRSRFGADESAEAAEQRRYDSRWLTLTKTFDGMHHLDGMLDPTSAATVLSALAPLSRRTADGDERNVGQRRADALVAIADLALQTGALPDVGGEKPQLVATLDYQQLSHDIDAAVTAGSVTLNGIEVSPATARMIACDAGIIPAVLGANGEVLDLGRKTPIWSVAQRRALNLESPGCGWPKCQNPRAHAHHVDFYSRGGHTDTKRGVNLCQYHHYVVHHTTWRIDKDPDGKIRTWRE